MVHRNPREIDQTKPLVEYIQKNIKKGYKTEQLKWSLISQGHSRVAVDKAINFVNELEEAKKPQKIDVVSEPVIEESFQIEEEKGFFGKLKDFFK